MEDYKELYRTVLQKLDSTYNLSDVKPDDYLASILHKVAEMAALASVTAVKEYQKLHEQNKP